MSWRKKIGEPILKKILNTWFPSWFSKFRGEIQKQQQQKTSDKLYEQIAGTVLKRKLGLEKYFLPLRVLTSPQNADNDYMPAII